MVVLHKILPGFAILQRHVHDLPAARLEVILAPGVFAPLAEDSASIRFAREMVGEVDSLRSKTRIMID